MADCYNHITLVLADITAKKVFKASFKIKENESECIHNHLELTVTNISGLFSAEIYEVFCTSEGFGQKLIKILKINTFSKFKFHWVMRWVFGRAFDN